MNVKAIYRTCWPIGQQAIGVKEALVPAEMTGWHTYSINWQRKSAQFTVDGNLILECNPSPGGPLGFVMWLDNQYMIATPWGKFGYGLLVTPAEQWMEVSRIDIANT